MDFVSCIGNKFGEKNNVEKNLLWFRLAVSSLVGTWAVFFKLTHEKHVQTLYNFRDNIAELSKTFLLKHSNSSNI